MYWPFTATLNVAAKFDSCLDCWGSSLICVGAYHGFLWQQGLPTHRRIPHCVTRITYRWSNLRPRTREFYTDHTFNPTAAAGPSGSMRWTKVGPVPRTMNPNPMGSACTCNKMRWSWYTELISVYKVQVTWWEGLPKWVPLFNPIFFMFNVK